MRLGGADRLSIRTAQRKEPIMLISGLQKTTLLDFPGRVAATVFLGGCNFRCPFCHNSELIAGGDPLFSPEEILSFLNRRSGILQGVCITGGEPTLQGDLEPFLEDIRRIGLAVKLDTNGSRPGVLRRLCERGLVDYIAMDIKSGPTGYAAAAGLDSLSLTPIRESISWLVNGSLPFEFRTTAVRGLHTEQDFREIGPLIAGCRDYYIQNYQDSPQVLTRGFSSFCKEELLRFLKLVAPYTARASLRGVDY